VGGCAGCGSGAAGACDWWGQRVGGGSLGDCGSLVTFVFVGHDNCEPNDHEDDACDECGDEEDEEDGQGFVGEPQ
jgi:hypothetical protein